MRISAAVVWLCVVGIGWGLLHDRPPEQAQGVPKVVVIAPTDMPTFPPLTFTDHISILVQCWSKDRGYGIISVDGKSSFYNGTHRVNINLPGIHQLRTWGSCYFEP